MIRFKHILLIVYFFVLITDKISIGNFHGSKHGRGMLFPRDSESRQSKYLNGMWNFRADTSPFRSEGFDSMWYNQPLDKWLNGYKVMSHEGGHLPFEEDITHALDYGGPNRLTVAVNNTLSSHTIPPGDTLVEKDIEVTQEYSFHFFNYAGIHRSVILYTTPPVFLSDITIATDYLFDTGIVKFIAEVGANDGVKRRDITMLYELVDKDGRQVATVGGTQLFHGELRVRRPSLWWPLGMGYQPGYLYTLKITTITKTSSDIYRLPVGIRSVKVLRTRFLINDAPFYFKGFGKQEDSDFRGRGFDYPTLVKDFNLLKWFGANSFRTSHYPYSEETMNLADELGFVIIDGSTAVGFSKLEYFNNRTLDRHLDVMSEVIQRDKNHPSVVMWSVANEPLSQYEKVADHLRKVISLTKEEDYQRRPVTFATFMNPHESEREDMAVKYCDVISFNRYYGWYTYPGKINQIARGLEWEMREWYENHRKPVMITEYGAEALAGLHRDPSVMYTEEYQVEVMKHYFPVFDDLRWEFLVGEMIWSFADFATPQTMKLIGGENRKGVLTRQRQPKASAHVLRSRYQSITLQHCHRCTGDELFDYLLRYKLTKRHSHSFEKSTSRFPALIREERVNKTVDRRSV